jgi:putative transposase
VDTKHYLFTCYRYIELNPVRAGVVRKPGDYLWSSYGANAMGDNGWISQHDEYLALGETPEQRCAAYRDLFNLSISDDDLEHIRQAAYYSQPIGGKHFKCMVEKKYGINIGRMERGRPKTKKTG